MGPRLRVYVSDQGHSCIRKAIELLGIGSANLRIVPTDDRFRMRTPILEAMIAEDRRAGYRPLAVVGSAGSTNTGSIDPLDRIAAICRQEDLWFHVDGAYGAPAVVTDRYRDALAGLALADSVAVDPHKWLQIPVEAGVVLVRDKSLLRDTFSLVPAYLRSDGGEDGVEGPISFAELGFQQTRGFRALKIWFGLRSLGKARIERLIDQNCRLAERLHAAVVDAPDLEALAPQSLSVVCFRAVPPSLRGDEAALDALNRSIVERIQLGGEFFVAKTVSEVGRRSGSASSTAGRGRRMSRARPSRSSGGCPFHRGGRGRDAAGSAPCDPRHTRWSAIQPAGQRRAAPSTKSGGRPHRETFSTN